MSYNLKNYYRKIAPFFNRIRFDQDKDILEDTKILQNYLNNKDGVLLEIGCGTARYSLSLKEMGHDVLGVDISLDQLKNTDGVLKRICASSTRLPFIEDYFNGCLAVFMFQQLNRKERHETLNEIFRTLRKDGILYIKTSSHKDISRQPFLDFFPSIMHVDFKRYPDIPELTEELKQNGFMVVEKKSNISKNLMKTSDLLFCVENKNISPLYLISESEFENGLKKLKAYYSNKEYSTVYLYYTLLICKKRKK
ncbi:MAG: class I SAM-dependent methyltransferase [Candidatus Aminicenantes bacterium]|nr:class I SAM-dependent methyltransferase [Candidatus Aminicenantes bacterium]